MVDYRQIYRCNLLMVDQLFFFFSSRRRHTRSYGDWSSDVCSSDLDQGNKTPARVPAFYFLDQLYSASAGHGKVENGDVPVELANELEGFIAVLGLADHVHVVLRGQDLFQTTPNDRVVVRD